MNEGVYFSIDLQLANNPIFYFDVQIAESVEEFFRKFLNNNEYDIDLIEDYGLILILMPF